MKRDVRDHPIPLSTSYSHFTLELVQPVSTRYNETKLTHFSFFFLLYGFIYLFFFFTLSLLSLLLPVITRQNPTYNNGQKLLVTQNPSSDLNQPNCWHKTLLAIGNLETTKSNLTSKTTNAQAWSDSNAKECILNKLKNKHN